MITIHRIFELYEIDPARVRLVRHGNKEIPVLKTFRLNLPKFEVYQSYQRPGKFGASSLIAVFAAYHKTTGLFLGLWDILGFKECSKAPKKSLSEIKRHGLPGTWMEEPLIRYNLRRNNALDELSERLVIEWGPATVSWVQKKDKEVVELKGKKAIAEFPGFNQIDLDYFELQKITQYPDANITWKSALSSVNGVYLIRDKASGKLYVGSAYGADGIFGRWSTYAQSGHGGNLELKGMDPNHFQFSILEIVAATITAGQVIECENRWKEKLGTRESGLNKN